MNAPGESRPYRVIVTGWRAWPETEKWFIWKELDLLRWRVPYEIPDDLNPNSIIIVEGECPYGGVDLFAKQWAQDRHQLVDPFPADWERYGRGAGPRRNSAMVGVGADLCIGFPGPDSKGTWDCLEKATKAGIETYSRSFHPKIRVGVPPVMLHPQIGL